MGQKVHPLGFRLGVSKMHLSQWFAEKKDYSEYLLEDNRLRKTIQERYTRIEKIEIFRQLDNHLEIKIFAENINFFRNFKFRQEIKKILLFQKYKKTILTNIKLYMLRNCTNQPSASLIANFIVNLLEKRNSYRQAFKLLFKKKLKGKQFRGLKVQVSGRLNGAEIARREWIKKGGLPLQTLNANIDYIFKQAYTIYGILGIKVWVFYGTKN
uniref:Small ribosomal subunit protein uS3c n=1 Tax=Glaukea argentea TaxID=2894057 RepID=A0A386B1J5_9CHLO|nr:ribosomal protein S3 [Udotea argentea]AYC65572.1 ribosomal protein S3 [Udotea argentea]